jgi:putative ABC transport system permease protein
MLRRLKALVFSRRLDRELDAELRFHIEMDVEQAVHHGMTPEAARQEAERRFGSIMRHTEDAREARGVRWFEDLAGDLRYGVRSLARSPGYVLFAVLTLGLGIGANTAMFSVLNGVVLKPLPYEGGDRLVIVRQSAPLAGQDTTAVSIAEYFDYREQADVFDGVVEYHQMNFDLLDRGEPDRVSTGVVSHNFFDVLGITPLLGRAFVAADDAAGAEAVLILSHSYWRTRFAADPAIVGAVFQMNDRPHRVIGVLPSVPHYPQENDVYMPVSACPFRAAAERTITANRRAFAALNVFGRLEAGVTPAQAAVSVGTVCHRFTSAHPEAYRVGTSGFQATTVGVREALTANARPMLIILLGTTAMVLLIACANVASLTLARTLRRDREIAMRTALGAGRGRLVRQLLTESALVALAGGGVGLLFAYLTVDMLTAFAGRFTERTGEVAVDGPVLAFTLLASMATGLLFGILPALSARVDLGASLKQGQMQAGDASSRRRLQGALIAAQVAVSVVLLAAAGLLAVSFHRLQQVDPGYRADGVLSAEVFGNFSRYGSADALRRLYVPLVERLAREPGVVAAAVTNAVPLAGQVPGSARFDIEGRAVDDPDRRPATDVRVASPQYFATLGITRLSGRVFTDLDGEAQAPVAVINRSMTRYWDGRDPLGSRISFDGGERWLTVVGVVADVRQFELARDAVAQVYIPLAQTPFGLAGRVLVRTAGDPRAFARTLREAVRAVDPQLPVENVQTLADLRDGNLASPRLTATLLAVFAGLAVAVTLAGLGGVIATSVSQRTREFGLRMALGASRPRVLATVLGQALAVVGVGLLLGVGGALALGRVLGAYLYQTAPTDPVVLAAVAGAFLLAGTLACLGPARRATSVDPLTALRAE